MATFTNQAVLSYNNVTTSSNVATGELISAITAAKTAVIDTYTVNDTVTYVISIVNTGSTAFGALTLADDLGAYDFGNAKLLPLTYKDGSVKVFINGVLQPTPTVTAGPPLTVTGINIPAGGNAVIIYEADVNQFAPLSAGSTVVNTATVSGTGITTPVSVTETVTVREAPDLTISKSITPSTVTENSRVTYTFVIQNYGSKAATVDDRVAVTDDFDPVLTDLSVTFNGETWTRGTQYNYNETTGLFTTVAGQITVPAATYTQDAETGAYVIEPGVAVLAVTGTI